MEFLLARIPLPSRPAWAGSIVMIDSTFRPRSPLQFAEPPEGTQARCREHLARAIEHAAHFLPSQGPISVFVHHNTLHVFEDMPFDQALKRGSRLFGCQPYLSEDRYRHELARGRIRPADVEAVLRDDLRDAARESIVGLCTRLELRRAMLQYPLRAGTTAELRWLVAESDALRRYREDAPAAVREQFLEETRHWVMRDLKMGLAVKSSARRPANGGGIHSSLREICDRFDLAGAERWSRAAWMEVSLHALWRVCRDGASTVATTTAAPRSIRHRDVLASATGVDTDRPVHSVLIRFSSAFLDQGLATWPLPARDQGFLKAFCAVYRDADPPEFRGLGLRDELRRVCAEGISPLECIQESLDLLGVVEPEWDDYLTATLLALRGWAGMIHQLETRPDRAARPIPAGSLVEYLAVRLLLERLAVGRVAREALGWGGPLAGIRHELVRGPKELNDPLGEQRAFLVFQLSQVLGWHVGKLSSLKKQDWLVLFSEIDSFSGLERRRVFQLAYERRYRIQTLDAIAVRAARGERSVGPRRYQAIFCIDEREESFRRHLEEIAPEAETFGTAGFFGTPINYRGAADAHFTPLCPVVIRPRHFVAEQVVLPFEREHRRRARTRRTLGKASRNFHLGSRSFLGGAILSALFGALSTIPLVARVLFPRLTARLRRLAGGLVQPPPVTRLQLERYADTPGPAEHQLGFTVSEMADIVERLLKDIALTADFAPLILVVGHGSSSLNNPHESAHDCGACGGGRGGPNARAFSEMANDPRVRFLLEQRDLRIPDSSYFVGAYHNTCDESMAYFDLDLLPASHREVFLAARADFDAARERNAHERCRRFESAPLDLTPEGALRHVEARAEDLAQTRPEYGHATNAVCIVGRRSRSCGLFLDRRAFLVSYDPTRDNDKGEILSRILQAVVPVCAGINLEYYFSYVDPTGWGCGTKLPHNITALLGIMDGATSDLRPGLPWQMVEIHEPVRLLFVIETTPRTMARIMEANEGIRQLCTNNWVQLATLDPQSAAIQVYAGGQFHPYTPEDDSLPCVSSSQCWYRGWRDHLGYALVEGASLDQETAS